MITAVVGLCMRLTGELTRDRTAATTRQSTFLTVRQVELVETPTKQGMGDAIRDVKCHASWPLRSPLFFPRTCVLCENQLEQ